MSRVISPTNQNLSIKDYFCRACNFHEDSGFYVRDVMEELGNKTVSVNLSEGRTLISHWFSSAIIDENAHTIDVIFDKNLAPYLFELKNFYTQYSLEYVLPMKSKYSIRLYEILRSVKSKSYRQRFTMIDISKIYRESLTRFAL